MDCKDDKLIKRYKETRRNHPLAAGGRIETAIAEERQRLSFLKKQSDYIIDTSNLLIRDLKKEIQHIFVEDKDYSNFYYIAVIWIQIRHSGGCGSCVRCTLPAESLLCG